MGDLPTQIRLEVKTSRGGNFSLDSRDLAGLVPGGYVAALIESRNLHGPRWTLVPGHQAHAGLMKDYELASLHAECPLAHGIQEGWSTWILANTSMEALINEGLSGIYGRVRWAREHYPPPLNASAGVMREIRLTQNLALIRKKIDSLTGSQDPQAEGRLHQALLKDVVQNIGYRIVNNPVGVPDIFAVLNS